MSTRLYTAAKSATTTRVEEIENISLSLFLFDIVNILFEQVRNTRILSPFGKRQLLFCWFLFGRILFLLYLPHPTTFTYILLPTFPVMIFILPGSWLNIHQIYICHHILITPPLWFYMHCTWHMYPTIKLGGYTDSFFDLTAIVNDGRWRYPNWPFWNFWPKGLLTKMVGKQCHRTILSFE